MIKNKSQEFEKEFSEFLSHDVAPTTSAAFAQNMLDQIHTQMNPPTLNVFAKLSFVQLLAGFVTLLFCPQFGIELTSSMGLMPYLMKYGEAACMLGCGAFFTGTSLFATSLLLRTEEIRVLKQNQNLQLLMLSGLSLGVLICFGAEVIASLGLIWIFGSLIGGILSLELGWKLRKTFVGRI